LTRNPGIYLLGWIPGQARNDGVGLSKQSESVTNPFKLMRMRTARDSDSPELLLKLTFMKVREGLSEARVFGLLALSVVAFSVPSVFFDLLVSDDLAFYHQASDGYWKIMGLNRLFLAPVINHYLTEIMVISPALARSVILLLGMAPVSILAYIVYTRVLPLPRTVAFFAALLPHILPGQQDIPTYVIGSYMTWGLLFYFLATLSSSAYLKGRRPACLISAALFYLAAIETTEVAIFLAVPLIALILGKYSIRRESLIVTGVISMAAAYKAIYVVLNPYGRITSPQAFDLSSVLDRIVKGVYYCFPNPGFIMSPYLPVFLLAFIALFFMVGIAFPSRFGESATVPVTDPSRHRKTLIFACLFGLAWFICSFMPFSVSHLFPSRYVYPAGFGLSLLIVVASYPLLARIRLGRLNLALPLLIIFAALVGLQRLETLNKIFSVREEAHKGLREPLLSFDFPAGAQIVVVGPGTGNLYTWGRWPKSTGYLRYTLERRDVSGQLGPEMAFYNPFLENSRGWSYIMCGLSLDAPLFLFRYDGTRLSQFAYFLMWERRGPAQGWTIFRLDRAHGKVSPFASGQDKAAYELALEKLARDGVSPGEILWTTQEKVKKGSKRKRLKGLPLEQSEGSAAYRDREIASY
jgi:hypothetical protein